MEGIGELFGGLARGATAGIQLNQNQRRIDLDSREAALQKRRLDVTERQADLTTRLTEAQIAKLQMELGDEATLGEVSREMYQAQSNVAQGEEILTKLRAFSGMPKSLRAANKDVMIRALKAMIGQDPPPNVVETFQKGTTEELYALLDAASNEIGSTPNAGAADIIRLLSNPEAFAEAIANLSQAQSSFSEEVATAGAGAANRSLLERRISAQVTALDQQIARMEAAMPRLRGSTGIAKLNKLLDTASRRRDQLIGTLLSNAPDVNSAVQTIDALEARGQLSPERAAAARARVVDSFGREPEGSLRLVQSVGEDGQPGGTFAFNTRSGGVSEVQVPGGGSLIPMSVQSGSAGEVFSRKTETGAAEGVAEGAQGIFEAGRLLKRVSRPGGKGLTGARGAFSQYIAGPIGQLSPGFAKTLASSVGAASPEERQQFMVDVRKLVGQSIPLFTGERSGRFTEQERKITAETVALSNAIDSPDQSIGALTGLLKLNFLDREFQAFKASQGKRTFSDIETDEGKVAVLAEALQQGLDENAAVELLNDLTAQRQQLFKARDFFLGEGEEQ